MTAQKESCLRTAQAHVANGPRLRLHGGRMAAQPKKRCNRQLLGTPPGDRLVGRTARPHINPDVDQHVLTSLAGADSDVNRHATCHGVEEATPENPGRTTS